MFPAELLSLLPSGFETTILASQTRLSRSNLTRYFAMLEQNIWTGTVDGIEIKWQQGGINRPDEQSKEVSTDTLTLKATTERMAYASTVRLGRTRVVIRYMVIHILISFISPKF